MVVGNADSQKMVEGAAYRDNWDLSVARANEVVRYPSSARAPTLIN